MSDLHNPVPDRGRVPVHLGVILEQPGSQQGMMVIVLGVPGVHKDYQNQNMFVHPSHTKHLSVYLSEIVAANFLQ